MGTYKIIEDLQKAGLYQGCLKEGIISTSVNFKKYVYEVFLRYKGKHKKSQAVVSTSEEVGKSERYVWGIIKDME